MAQQSSGQSDNRSNNRSSQSSRNQRRKNNRHFKQNNREYTRQSQSPQTQPNSQQSQVDRFHNDNAVNKQTKKKKKSQFSYAGAAQRKTPKHRYLGGAKNNANNESRNKNAFDKAPNQYNKNSHKSINTKQSRRSTPNSNRSSQSSNHKQLYWEKFANSTVSFEDKLFQIFISNKSRNKPLQFKFIQAQLQRKFNTTNVTYEDVKDVRFLYECSNNTNAFVLYLRSDDICPNGANCRLNAGVCCRIHFISNQHICAKPYIDDKYGCDNMLKCPYLHFPDRKITHMILDIIFRMFKRKTIESGGKKLYLMGYEIDGHNFIRTFKEFNPVDPLPNMTVNQWIDLVRTYNKYYFDYAQQFRDRHANNGNSGFVSLWRAYRAPGYNSNKEWYIKVHLPPAFFSERTCKYYSEYSIQVAQKQKYKYQCRFQPTFLCPYLHLHGTHVSYVTRRNNNNCEICWNGGKVCDKWHMFKNSASVAYPLPASVWKRSKKQAQSEIRERVNGKSVIHVTDMNDSDFKCYNKWCDTLQSIFEKNRRNGTGKDKQELDCGFHFKYRDECVGVKWDKLRMKPLQIIDCLFDYFVSEYKQRVIDIQLEGLQKNIVLKVRVHNLANVCYGLRRDIAELDKQWCFGHPISFKVEIQKNNIVLFEFQNVNTFVTIKMLKEWFQSTLDIYNGGGRKTPNDDFRLKPPSFKLQDFEFIDEQSQYTFVNGNKSLSHNAIVYFADLDFDPATLVNPMINNNVLMRLEKMKANVTDGIFIDYRTIIQPRQSRPETKEQTPNPPQPKHTQLSIKPKPQKQTSHSKPQSYSQISAVPLIKPKPKPQNPPVRAPQKQKPSPPQTQPKQTPFPPSQQTYAPKQKQSLPSQIPSQIPTVPLIKQKPTQTPQQSLPPQIKPIRPQQKQTWSQSLQSLPPTEQFQPQTFPQPQPQPNAVRTRQSIQQRDTQEIKTEMDSESSSLSPMAPQMPQKTQTKSTEMKQNSSEFEYSTEIKQTHYDQKIDYGTKESDFYTCDKPRRKCEICKPFPKNSNYDPNKVVYLGKLWEDRHKSSGQAYKDNKDLEIFTGPKCEVHMKNHRGECECEDHNQELDDCQHNIDKYKNLNALCRYCLLAPWSDKHKQECMFIPNFVVKGLDNAEECIMDQTSFHGHYVRPKNRWETN